MILTGPGESDPLEDEALAIEVAGVAPVGVNGNGAGRSADGMAWVARARPQRSVPGRNGSPPPL